MPEFPADGIIDLHCHILPGIDDGCRNLDESLLVVRHWRELGIRGAICTPHVCTSWYPDNNPARITAWVAALQLALDEVGIDFQLWPGGEVRLAEQTIDWFGEHGVPTSGPGRAVLIDWWGRDWPACCNATIEWLFDQGYQPVLAHPERMGLDEVELQQVIDDLLARGVWLQGNLNSLGGGEGRDAQRRADAWLAAGRYHLLASDTHGPDSVAGRAAGLARVRQHYGEATVQKLLVDRPREVMQWGR
jgi:protein-tyrosine phosphatase